MGIGCRIRELRKIRGLQAVELAAKADISKQLLYQYETEKVAVPSPKIEKIAAALNTTPGYLMGWTSEQEAQATVDHVSAATINTNASTHRIPVLGRVAAGIPIEANEEILGWEEIPACMASQGRFFALRIQGDSMEPIIRDGDIVIVKKQETADDGDTVIAIIDDMDGSEGVCKRFKKVAGGIALISNNPAYDPMYFTEEGLKQTPVYIVGRVTELRRRFL